MRLEELKNRLKEELKEDYNEQEFILFAYCFLLHELYAKADLNEEMTNN